MEESKKTFQDELEAREEEARRARVKVSPVKDSKFMLVEVEDNRILEVEDALLLWVILLEVVDSKKPRAAYEVEVFQGKLDVAKEAVQQADEELKLAIVQSVVAPQVDETPVVMTIAVVLEGRDDVLAEARQTLEEAHSMQEVEVAAMRGITTLREKVALDFKTIEVGAIVFQRKVVELKVELRQALKAKMNSTRRGDGSGYRNIARYKAWEESNRSFFIHEGFCMVLKELSI
ncbi:hypothetical protein ACLOJK_030133 [Asimina triloba]